MHSYKRQHICTAPSCCRICLLCLYVWAWTATQIWLSLCKTRACVCLPALWCFYVYFIGLFVYVTTWICVMYMHVCIGLCFLHVIPVEVMVCLCLSGVNPHHLAVIGSFLLYWNPKWLNHTSYGKQSIFGSVIHSTSKPQIAPIKGPVWHAHTHKHTVVWSYLTGIYLRFFSFPSSSHLSALVLHFTLDVCEQHLDMFACLWFLCFDNKRVGLIAGKVSC